MHTNTDLRVLFPTSFSDACFRTARAIAQLADNCRISLTIAHVIEPGANATERRRELDSFFAEADHYDRCSRVLLENEDPVKAIAGLCEQESFDLIVAPASDRLGLHSFFNTSFRARLLEKCKVPVWTVGACLDHAQFKNRIRTVACLVDLESEGDQHLPLAVSFAAQVGARVQVLHVIPPAHEGMLAGALFSDAPLMPEVAMERIRTAFAGQPCPDVEIVVGEGTQEIPRLLNRSQADLVFVGKGQALSGTWWPRLSAYLDRLPCPVVCVDGASGTFDRWTFQEVATPEKVFSREYAFAS